MTRNEALELIDRIYGEFVEDFLNADLSKLEDFTPLNERILSALEDAGMNHKWEYNNEKPSDSGS